MAGRFLKLFSPFIRITPEIKQPDREISFKDKLIYTFIVLLIYTIMSNVPIFGVLESVSADYYYWLRVILASNRGTLTELGIGPIVTAGLILQLLQGSKLIEVNMSNPEDRALFTGAQKVITVVLTILQIIAYIFGDAFGDSSELGAANIILIFLQLLFAGILIMMMDEVLQKGYGLGSGVSLFIASGVAGQIFWNSFSFFSDRSQDGLPTGIIIAFFSVLFKSNTDVQLKDLWIRTQGDPGLLGLITTLIIFFVVIYVETMRVEIPLTYAGYKGYRGKYPMKLLYVSNIPVILAQALYANLLFFGQLLWKWSDRTGKLSWWVNWFGVFEQPEGAQYYQPVKGLLKYITAPQGLGQLINAFQEGNGGSMILQSLIYMVIFITICIVFGQIWVEVSGLAPRDIAGQILGSRMQVPGFRRNEKVIEKILKRYIGPLTILCGFIVGMLSFLADFLGALSSGTGLLLTVGIIQNYAETISQEAAKEQFPGMGALLG
ncbi:MAG: preprotein translocase subunit SecY [Promethearchaeia archaeon]|nr:MAG: preprotein translocase subunit SecY [Candidatus Lokiarchaeia archaeon]